MVLADPPALRADGKGRARGRLNWESGARFAASCAPGWDPEHGEYRASMVDNYGNAMVYRGWIDGDRLLFESLADAAVRLRFTWDASDPGVVLWRNEMAVGDGEWFLIEQYPMVSA